GLRDDRGEQQDWRTHRLRMIAKVPRHGPQRPRRPQRNHFSLGALHSLRSLRALRSPIMIAVVLCGLVLCGPLLHAHDFERTQVTLTFARDGAFVLDVANDAAWLE